VETLLTRLQDRSSGGVTAGVSEIIVHPDFSSSTLDNDVAIWKLSEDIAEDGSALGYAGLPSAGFDPADGDSVTVAGWGALSEGGSTLPSALQKVSVPVVGRDACNDSYGGEISDVMFCAGVPEGGLDACQGDSGGPIRDDATGNVVGVVSWGQGCARPDFPGVYANVGALTSFITANI
jgi:trypsin